MSKIDEFGKDLGLVHEMVVTGRKAAMTPQAYAFLAHNEGFFGKLAGIIRHQAVLDKNGIEAMPANKELAEKLIEDVGSINDGCIHCMLSQRGKSVWHLYLPYGFCPEADNTWSWKTDKYNGIDWEEATRRYETACKKMAKAAKGSTEYALFEQQREQFHARERLAFRRMLTIRLKEIGLTPQELVEFTPAFVWHEDFPWIGITEECYEYSKHFAPVIRQLVEQRAILAMLK